MMLDIGQNSRTILGMGMEIEGMEEGEEGEGEAEMEDGEKKCL